MTTKLIAHGDGTELAVWTRGAGSVIGQFREATVEDLARAVAGLRGGHLREFLQRVTGTFVTCTCGHESVPVTCGPAPIGHHIDCAYSLRHQEEVGEAQDAIRNAAPPGPPRHPPVESTTLHPSWPAPPRHELAYQQGFEEFRTQLLKRIRAFGPDPEGWRAIYRVAQWVLEMKPEKTV